MCIDQRISRKLGLGNGFEPREAQQHQSPAMVKLNSSLLRTPPSL